VTNDYYMYRDLKFKLQYKVIVLF